jgi:ribosomal protein L11 methylase PrmA
VQPAALPEADVGGHLADIGPAVVWDLGANTGAFSRIAAKRGIDTVAFDIDPACVERNYKQVRRDGESHLLPLLLDLNSPSPALGWALRERSSIADRADADCVMALALVHHLAISNNVPLAGIADFFARLAPNLLSEFVPKSDPKVAILLATRADVFPDYTESGFEAAFERRFEIVRKDRIDGSKRTLYRLRRRTTSSA